MEGPHIQLASTGAQLPLQPEVTTVGRGKHVDIRLADPSVSLLHAEIVRRGPYVYVMDLGLSRNGTRVNGRLVARRVLADGDAITFLRIVEGPNRRIRLANEVITLGLAKPELPGELNGARQPLAQPPTLAAPRQAGPAPGERRGVTSQSGEPA